MIARLGPDSRAARWLLAFILISTLLTGTVSATGAKVARDTIAGAPALVSVESSPGSSASSGTTVTFTAKVLDSNYYVCDPAQNVTNCGTVTFTFTGATVATAPDIALTQYDDPDPTYGAGNGIATYPVSNLNPGTTFVVARYNGDGRFTTAKSSTTLAYTISVGSTLSTTSIRASSGASTSASMLSVNGGDTVTFTATAADGSGATSPPTPTGSVQFMDGNAPLGAPAALMSGVATFPTTSLAGGSHSITAIYSGDSTYAASTSAPVTVSVTSLLLTSATSMMASSGGHSSAAMLAVNAGDTVTFTATAADGSGTINPPTPTGSVQFMDGNSPLGIAVSLVSGTATLSTTSLTNISHSITAVYSGDGTYAASTSAPVTVTVTLSNSGIVTPSSIASGFGISIAVTIIGPNASVNAVSVDLTPIGLTPTALIHQSGAQWSTIVTVPNSAPVGGPYSLPVTLTDGSNTMMAGMPLSATIIRQARSISIAPADGSVIAGETKAFTLSATYTNGTTAIVASGVTWRTGSTSVATVDVHGNVTASRSGGTILSARYGGLTTTIPITIVAGGAYPPPPGKPSPAAPPVSQPQAHAAGDPNTHTNGATTAAVVPNPAPPRH